MRSSGTLAMIPEFEEYGYLPPGIHLATLDEIEARFGLESEIRRVQMESLRWLADLVHRSGAERLVINGSFTTNTNEPNDLDCAVMISEGMRFDPEIDEEFELGLPFLQIEVLLPGPFSWLVDRMFASDRDMVPKGVVEVIL